MKYLFVPYELAVKAKEKGFNEPCLKLYNDNAELYLAENCKNNEDWMIAAKNNSAPLYQQLVDWFREKHGLIIGVDWHGTAYFYLITTILPYDRSQSKNFEGFHEALTKALEEAFKLI